MIIAQALTRAEQQLARLSSTPSLDAEVLLAHVLRCDKTYLLVHREKALTAGQSKKLQTLVRKRKTGVPVAYLTGHKEFYGLDFLVDKRVLVPRPETELLVEQSIQAIQDLKLSDAKIADIGTGSGCIAITLKKLSPTTTIYGTDMSAGALSVATKNARKNKIKVSFKKGNLLQPLADQPLDGIIANLPYGTKALFNAKKLRHEPSIALYAKDFGLDLIKKLLQQVAQRNDIKFIALEFDPRQKQKLQALTKRLLPKSSIHFFRDYANLWRGIVIMI